LIQEIKWFQSIRERDKERREWINEKGKCLIWEWNQVFGLVQRKRKRNKGERTNRRKTLPYAWRAGLEF